MSRLVKGSSWPNLFSARLTVKLRRCWAKEDSQREKRGREKGGDRKDFGKPSVQGRCSSVIISASSKPSVKSLRVTNGSLSGFFILFGGGGWI